MALTITHTFVSSKSDSPDDTLIRPSNWNDTHTLTGTVEEALLGFSDITTANVSTSMHGLAPKLPGTTTTFLSGAGAYTVPLTLTTTGSSGVATFIAGTLNIPDYTSGGSGTVTTVSVVSTNGFAGTVANPTTTPAITIETSITGLLKGNGTAISAAVGDTDYQNPITLTTTGSSGAATFIGDTLNIPIYSGGGGGSVDTVSVVTANGFAGTVANATSTPAITIETSITGLLKGNGTAISEAIAGTDYQTPPSINVVSFSATPSFDFSLGVVQQITLTGNVTSSTTANIPTGQKVTFVIIQDGTGGHTFVWPTNVKGAMTISSTLNSVNVQEFISYDGTNLHAVSLGVTS